jgi:hypothetical protein
VLAAEHEIGLHGNQYVFAQPTREMFDAMTGEELASGRWRPSELR